MKEAVFPFNMFPEVDPILGPEMRSTGEVLGLADDFGTAFFKAQEATKTTIPLSGCAFISVSDGDKGEAPPLARQLIAAGFTLVATKGTYDLLNAQGIACGFCHKLTQGQPNLLDLIGAGKISLIINTPVGKQSALDDSYIRKAAIKGKLFYATTMAGAKATVQAIMAMQNNQKQPPKSLQEYHGNR